MGRSNQYAWKFHCAYEHRTPLLATVTKEWEWLCLANPRFDAGSAGCAGAHGTRGVARPPNRAVLPGEWREPLLRLMASRVTLLSRAGTDCACSEADDAGRTAAHTGRKIRVLRCRLSVRCYSHRTRNPQHRRRRRATLAAIAGCNGLDVATAFAMWGRACIPGWPSRALLSMLSAPSFVSCSRVVRGSEHQSVRS